MTSTTTTATAGPMNAPDPSPDPAPPPPLPAAQRPLAGLLVLDFSQFLAGPSCALRLADMGARVVKIERPQGGDLGRRLYISNLEFEGDSTLFHSINRNADQGPVPMGLAVADILAGAHLAQGILACLVRRGITGEGGLVEVSLLESVLDFQFEVLTTHLNDGGKVPQRSAINNAHAYLAAPYGIYATADGFLALAMTPIS